MLFAKNIKVLLLFLTFGLTKTDIIISLKINTYKSNLNYNCTFIFYFFSLQTLDERQINHCVQSESGTIFETGSYMIFTAETTEPESLVGNQKKSDSMVDYPKTRKFGTLSKKEKVWQVVKKPQKILQFVKEKKNTQKFSGFKQRKCFKNMYPVVSSIFIKNQFSWIWLLTCDELILFTLTFLTF